MGSLPRKQPRPPPPPPHVRYAGSSLEDFEPS